MFLWLIREDLVRAEYILKFRTGTFDRESFDWCSRCVNTTIQRLRLPDLDLKWPSAAKIGPNDNALILTEQVITVNDDNDGVGFRFNL